MDRYIYINIYICIVVTPGVLLRENIKTITKFSITQKYSLKILLVHLSILS